MHRPAKRDEEWERRNLRERVTTEGLGGGGESCMERKWGGVMRACLGCGAVITRC